MTAGELVLVVAAVLCSLGFTALDGLCMATRPGALDPGVVLHLFQTLGLSAPQVEKLLYEKSGLLGISGVSSDMRALLALDAPDARLAVDYFIYRAAKEIGALDTHVTDPTGLVVWAAFSLVPNAFRPGMFRPDADPLPAWVRPVGKPVPAPETPAPTLPAPTDGLTQGQRRKKRKK